MFQLSIRVERQPKSADYENMTPTRIFHTIFMQQADTFPLHILFSLALSSSNIVQFFHQQFKTSSLQSLYMVIKLATTRET